MAGITIKNLVKQWDDFRAVDGVSFTAEEGTLTVLLGPSGCGKSTILRMLSGLEPVDSGEIWIGQDDVTHQDPAKRGVSMVFQSYALFPHLSVKENILFGLKVRRVEEQERQSRLKEAAQLVGLQDLLNRRPAQLSGGQRQRVALARTIVSKQPVCLMDEPLSNLDAKLRAEMRDQIHELQRRLNLTMVYVTHDQTEAMSMADQVVLLRDGKIEQIGSPATLYEQPGTGFAAQFLGTPPMNVLPVSILNNSIMSRPSRNSAEAEYFGIRPEKIHLSESGLPAEVSAVDYMGAETVLRFQYQDQIIMARIHGRADTIPGDKLSIHWDDGDVHLFDKQGVRL